MIFAMIWFFRLGNDAGIHWGIFDDFLEDSIAGIPAEGSSGFLAPDRQIFSRFSIEILNCSKTNT